MIIVAIIGLPITIVLAWIFDITEGHIEVQAEATDTVVIPFGGRKGDFVVIMVPEPDETANPIDVTEHAGRVPELRRDRVLGRPTRAGRVRSRSSRL